MYLYYNQPDWILDYAGLSCFCPDWTWCFWIIISKYVLLFLSTQNETHQWGLQLCRVRGFPITSHSHHISHTFSTPDTQAFSQCLLPRSLLLHGKLFPGGHTVYSCSVLSFHENLPFMTVSCRLWWALILSCSLHPGFNFVLCLTWLSFYSTILKVPWGQRQNWVLLAFHLLCLGTCSKYSINVCRMNERRTEWVS